MKKRTAQQEALSQAKRQKERRFFCSRDMCWANGTWPFRWSFYTNWRSLTIALGEPKNKFHGESVPESVFQFTIGI